MRSRQCTACSCCGCVRFVQSIWLLRNTAATGMKHFSLEIGEERTTNIIRFVDHINRQREGIIWRDIRHIAHLSLTISCHFAGSFCFFFLDVVEMSINYKSTQSLSTNPMDQICNVQWRSRARRSSWLESSPPRDSYHRRRCCRENNINAHWHKIANHPNWHMENQSSMDVVFVFFYDFVNCVAFRYTFDMLFFSNGKHITEKMLIDRMELPHGTKPYHVRAYHIRS